MVVYLNKQILLDSKDINQDSKNPKNVNSPINAIDFESEVIPFEEFNNLLPQMSGSFVIG